jgi:hypothetical protein
MRNRAIQPRGSRSDDDDYDSDDTVFETDETGLQFPEERGFSVGIDSFHVILLAVLNLWSTLLTMLHLLGGDDLSHAAVPYQNTVCLYGWLGTAHLLLAKMELEGKFA